MRLGWWNQLFQPRLGSEVGADREEHQLRKLRRQVRLALDRAAAVEAVEEDGDDPRAGRLGHRLGVGQLLPRRVEELREAGGEALLALAAELARGEGVDGEKSGLGRERLDQSGGLGRGGAEAVAPLPEGRRDGGGALEVGDFEALPGAD